MARSKGKTIYVCQSCGAQRPRWEGRCTECGEWNSYVEERLESPKASPSAASSLPIFSMDSAQASEPNDRVRTDISELDRVLGGGLVPGSFLLLGGEPGIGKSTLVLQIAHALAKKDKDILYISAEESVPQTSQRAHRLGMAHQNMFLGSESNLESIIKTAKEKRPECLIVDSVQTVFLPEITSAPGSVSQVRECAGQLMTLAKSEGICVILIGHVTKDGSLAGPKVLEHLVDTVLHFEGDQHHQYRILRALKNRFGATNEVGIFEMNSRGLREIKNPSELFLEERAQGAIGSAVLSSLEGSRPLLCEVQALTVSSPMPMPRRTTLGFDLNRVHLLTAVLDRFAHLQLAHKDVFVNVVGGLKINEPAADLAVAAALISSEKNTALDPKAIFFGEVGLNGEVRAVSFPEMRIKEAEKLGFEKFYLPFSCKKGLQELETKLKSKIIWIHSVEHLQKTILESKHKKTPQKLNKEVSAEIF